MFITHDLDEALKLADHLVILKDGEVVQQREPQYILMNTHEPYIIYLISDINCVRVLRARTVTKPTQDDPGSKAGTVAENDTLEHLIAKAKAKGNAVLTYRMMRNDRQAGIRPMRDVFIALVPTDTSVNGMRKAS